MFLLGAWRNYDELEECMTLDELVATYNKFIDRENERMEFDAKIAGAEFTSTPNSDKDTSQHNKPQAGETMADRIRRRRESKQPDKPTEFSHGVGYRTIGG